MPKAERQKLIAAMHELAGDRRRYKAEMGANLQATPQQASLEIMEATALLLDDWNAELELAHQRLTDETQKLAAATERLDRSTEQLDVSTNRLDKRTLNLTRATWVLIGATVVLTVATLFLAYTKFL